jgi:hypothetical protein
MLPSRLALAALVAALFALEPTRVGAQDIDACFATADRVASGAAVTEADKEAGHKACQAALAASSSVVQKSQIQDADFDIIGRPAQKPN